MNTSATTSARYDAVWQASQTYLRARKNDVHAPLTTLMLAALFHEAVLPAGEFNVATGLEAELGRALGVMSVNGAKQAVALTNAAPYGPAGCVFSGSLAPGLAIAEQLEAGSVWVNDIQRSHHNAPFGGMKISGFGREQRREGLEASLETKTIYFSYHEARM